jgi:hypothetical protein
MVRLRAGTPTPLGWSNPKGVRGVWDSGLTPRIPTEKSTITAVKALKAMCIGKPNLGTLEK